MAESFVTGDKVVFSNAGIDRLKQGWGGPTTSEDLLDINNDSTNNITVNSTDAGWTNVTITDSKGTQLGNSTNLPNDFLQIATHGGSRKKRKSGKKRKSKKSRKHKKRKSKKSKQRKPHKKRRTRRH